MFAVGIQWASEDCSVHNRQGAFAVENTAVEPEWHRLSAELHSAHMLLAIGEYAHMVANSRDMAAQSKSKLQSARWPMTKDGRARRHSLPYVMLQRRRERGGESSTSAIWCIPHVDSCVVNHVDGGMFEFATR